MLSATGTAEPVFGQDRRVFVVDSLMVREQAGFGLLLCTINNQPGTGTDKRNPTV